jgi:hypothetical protein
MWSSAWFSTLAAHLEPCGGLQKLLVFTSIASKSVGMEQNFSILLKHSRIENHISRETHSKGREIIHSAVRNIIKEGIGHFLHKIRGRLSCGEKHRQRDGAGMAGGSSARTHAR